MWNMPRIVEAGGIGSGKAEGGTGGGFVEEAYGDMRRGSMWQRRT